MSTHPIPVEPVVIVEGPDSLGHRIPAIRTPGKIAAQVARLTMNRGPNDPPLVSESELLALLAGLGDRYAIAREKRESFIATIEARGHDGRHRGFFWTERRQLTPPLP